VSDPALVTDATVVLDEASVWFGQKVALSQLTCSFGAGVTGLLGPNGAGKSTLMRVIAGLTELGSGSVSVAGRDPRRDRGTHRHLGFVPEDEQVPPRLSARQLVRYRADLHGVREPARVEAALAQVDLVDVADKQLTQMSKGMKQRAKVAAALVSRPGVLVLDEPLNGADPVQRARLIALFQRLGAEGCTVIVSSHVLHEVERMADRVLVLVAGRLAAAGGHRAIRDAMDGRPRRVLIRVEAPRPLAAALVALEAVAGVELTAEGIVVTTDRASELASALPPLARDLGTRLREVRPLDDSLDSLFRELVR
jgi:ABC-2 type transport system ATP-binding protein